MSTIHRGINIHRLASNEREAKLSKAWEEFAPRNLAYLIGDDYTPRDAEIAATIIQWLGSNVGRGFILDNAGVRE